MLHRGDLASGCIGFVFALAVCFGARAMPMGSIRDPGAGFMPFWVGAALAAMSLVLMSSVFLPLRKFVAPKTGELNRYQVAWMVGGLLFYGLALEPLGYLVTTFLLLGALLWILGERRWLSAVAFSALVTGASYALFGLWLGVPLPGGIIAR